MKAEINERSSNKCPGDQHLWLGISQKIETFGRPKSHGICGFLMISESSLWKFCGHPILGDNPIANLVELQFLSLESDSLVKPQCRYIHEKIPAFAALVSLFFRAKTILPLQPIDQAVGGYPLAIFYSSLLKKWHLYS